MGQRNPRDESNTPPRNREEIAAATIENAIYELGVRHALRPNTTIVIAES